MVIFWCWQRYRCDILPEHQKEGHMNRIIGHEILPFIWSWKVVFSPNISVSPICCGLSILVIWWSLKWNIQSPFRRVIGTFLVLPRIAVKSQVWVNTIKWFKFLFIVSKWEFVCLQIWNIWFYSLEIISFIFVGLLFYLREFCNW